jgi:hypothetical protein
MATVVLPGASKAGGRAMTEEPLINPLLYFVIGFWIFCTVFGIVSAMYQSRSVTVQSSEIMKEIARVTMTLRLEGRATRELLMRQDRRRIKRLAREAKLRLDFGANAEGAIAVQRILEGEEQGDL